MSTKVTSFTDPACRTFDGDDRILWVPSEASQVWARRGGKAVQLHANYRAAVANSSRLAGFIETDMLGATGGHPASVVAGDLIPVNFGNDKTCVFPTTGRAPTINDIGKVFNIQVIANTQYVELNSTSPGSLRLEKIIDDSGKFVSCSIPLSVRHGEI